MIFHDCSNTDGSMIFLTLNETLSTLTSPEVVRQLLNQADEYAASRQPSVRQRILSFGKDKK